MVHSQAVVAVGANTVELQDVQVAHPTDEQILVRNCYSVMSPGTELRLLSGRLEAITFPFVPGYSSAGVVEKAGAKSGFVAGDHVACCGGGGLVGTKSLWGSHCRHVVVNRQQVVRVPEGATLKQACLAKIAAIPYHGYRLALAERPTPSKVVVLGLGLIGQISARFFGSTCPTLAADVDPHRTQAAARGGVEAICVDKDLEPLLTDHADSSDVLVDSTGVASLIDPALGLLRYRPAAKEPQRPSLYLIQGSYAGAMPISYHAAFQKQAMFLVTRDHLAEDAQAAVEAIARGVISVDDLIDSVVAPADAGNAYRELQNRTSMLTAVLDWSAD